jgi:hypothetical protein
MDRPSLSKKIFACGLIAAVVFLIVFATVALFRGDMYAAASTFPFLLVVYLFVLAEKRHNR